MKTLNDIWAYYARQAGIIDQRPDFSFNPDFYAKTYPDMKGDAGELMHHFIHHGRTEGRYGTYYTQLRAEAPHIDLALSDLIVLPELKTLIDENHPEALHLAFELIQLGSPTDAAVSDFSMQAYLAWHPDIQAAKMNPLMHYLRFGSVEGGRRTLGDLRKSLIQGERPYRPELPTVLICMHEMSLIDVSAVGRALVFGASHTHNVAVATFRGGEILDQILPHCCAVLITTNPLHEIPYVEDEVFQQIDHAILNSPECALFIHPLVARDIPFATYIHEYSEYTLPVWKAIYSAAFSDLMIFNAEHVRDNWQGRLADVAFDTSNDSAVIPPRSLIQNITTKEQRITARKALSKMMGRDLGDARLIFGTGPLHWRKGTDIFVQAAQICARIAPETVFIWIRERQNRQDMGFDISLDYHLRQGKANRKDSNLFFLPAGRHYHQVLDACDAMFLSSRFDPLPNAVLDAVQRGCRVVCFDGGTGFADPHYRGSDMITSVAYGDPGEAVNALLALPRKVDAVCGPAPAAHPEWPLFHRIHDALQSRLTRQRNFVVGETAIDIPLLFTKSDADRPLRQREREKLFRYGRRLLWRDVKDAQATITASDNWIHKRLLLEEYRNVPASDPGIPDFAVHIHAFYIDGLAADLRQHACFTRASRILVTTDTEEKARHIRQIGADQGLKIETHLVPNQGRDILPFLRLFGRDGLAGDDNIWCHLHQKKSVQTTSHGDVWRRFLHRILLGDQDNLSMAVLRIAQTGVGFIAPFEPHFVPWSDSRRLLPDIADHFPGPMPENPLLFPVGNMFWTHANVARAMLELFGEDYAWPHEPIPTDGTEYHLIERLWPAIAARMDLVSVFLHKNDEERV